MSVPLDAIDPQRALTEWTRAFEWHLDQIPPLMEAMGVLRLPVVSVSRGGSRFDRAQITGGGYDDYAPLVNVDSDGNGRVVATGVAADQADLWVMLVEYTRAVTAWLNSTIPAPYAPLLPPLAHTHWQAPKPNGDPLTARRESLLVIGWLIDHAAPIYELSDLEPFREDMFTAVRRAKARYRATATPRRARPRACDVCGECAVLIDWVDGANGSPKPVQVGLCKVCGQTYGADGG